MSHLDVYTNAYQAENINRLTVAVAEVARDVFTEGAGVADHDLRMQLLNHAGPRTADYERFAREIAVTVMTHPSWNTPPTSRG